MAIPIEPPQPPVPSVPEFPTPTGPRPVLVWTLDLCANAIFSPIIRPAADEPEPGDEGYDGFERGFHEIRTTHPVRAVAVQEPGASTEACRYHYGKTIALIDGFHYKVFCSEPITDARPTQLRQTAIAERFLAVPMPGQPDQVEPGFHGSIGAYHTPFWTETRYDSEGVVCVAELD